MARRGGLDDGTDGDATGPAQVAVAIKTAGDKGGDFDMFTIGRGADSYVFYDLDYLRRNLEPHFRILSVTEEVRLYQNALLLERS